MCCSSLDSVIGRFFPEKITLEKSEEGDVIHVKGMYDRAPSSGYGRFSRYLQRLELCEKIAEIVDESFHLMQPLLQQYTNAMVYQTLRNLHHGAHTFEHVLHPFCVLGDGLRLLSGTFFTDQEGKRLNQLCMLSRICHAVAHCFATADFLHKLQLCSLERYEKIFKYAAFLSTLGHALWAISLIWQRYQGEENEWFTEEMGIHLGGCLFEAVHVVEGMGSLSPAFDSIVGKIGSLAGVIHAWCVVQLLMPKDRESIEFELTLPEKEKEIDNDSEDGITQKSCSPNCFHVAYTRNCWGITCHPVKPPK